jgi:hypothetical protein
MISLIKRREVALHGEYHFRESGTGLAGRQEKSYGDGGKAKHIGGGRSGRPHLHGKNGRRSLADPVYLSGKARASACFGIPSADLTDRAMPPVFRAVMEVEKGEFVPGQGALPIMKNGEFIGAIGGSGGTSQEDEDAARAGIAAL